MKYTINTAIKSWLFNEYPYVAISSLELFKKFLILFHDREYLEQKISLPNNASLESRFHSFKKNFKAEGFENIKNHFILDKSKDISPASIICSIYPETYISNLSAMRFYSITDRLPKVTQLVTPTRAEWKKKAQIDFLKFNELYNLDVETASLYKKYSIPFPDTKNGRLLNFQCETYSKSQVSPYTQMPDGTRIIAIGNLFIEMLENFIPCGGIDHVLDTYINFGLIFKEEIFTSLPQYSNITQAKVGFIFEQLLGLKNNNFLSEIKYKQREIRGGSRKFISFEPYSDIYSPEWNISLNHDRLYKYGIRQNDALR